MASFYVAAYLLFWVTAVILTVLRRSRMIFLMWPIVLLYPYAWVRSQFPFLPLGLHDLYVFSCMALLLVDLSKIRRVLDPGVMRLTLVLLLVTMVAHAWGLMVLLINHPSLGWTLPLINFAADMRFLPPVFMVAVYVDSIEKARVASRSFVFAIIVGFSLVVADGYSPVIYDLFNHTAYQSRWQDHIRRAVGGFSGPWEVGAIAAMSATAGLAMIGRRRLASQTPVAVLFILSFLGTTLSLSRTGLVSWVLGVFGMGVFSPWKSRWRLVLPMVATAVVLLSLRFGQSEWESVSVVDIIETRFETAFVGGHLAGSAKKRVSIWDQQWDWISTGQYSTSELWLGVGGLEGSVLNFRASSHSGFFGPFLYYGLPLGLLLQIVLGILLVKAVQLGTRTHSPGIPLLVVVMLSTMISGEFLTSNLSAAVFAFLIALLARVESFHLEQGAIRSIAVKGPRPAALPG
jgi:hypothetical protein